MHPQGCPDQAELEGFVLGKLSERTFTRVTDHVESCVACKMSLASLDQAADPLLSELRRFSPQDGTESEPVLQELIAAVSRARAECTAPAWFTADGDGRRIGKFELLERLGAGSFGYVFRARDTELGRMVAIKIPRAGSLASEEDATRFLREARSAAQLKHPGIVALHETGQTDDGTLYLVEEFVQGSTLGSRLSGGSFSFHQAAGLIACSG